MIIAIDARTIGQEEVPPGLARDGGLDPADGFGDEPELGQGPHVGGWRPCDSMKYIVSHPF
jgi:hypothetical protein